MVTLKFYDSNLIACRACNDCPGVWNLIGLEALLPEIKIVSAIFRFLWLLFRQSYKEFLRWQTVVPQNTTVCN